MDLGLDDVKATLADYFDGIYDSSEEKLRSAFHPEIGRASCRERV